MSHLLYVLYSLMVLIHFPSIPADVKGLSNSQFQVREAAAKRLESLPGWTAFYFKYHAIKGRDLEERLRCLRVHETLLKKWEQDLLKPKADIILALHPTIPRDIETLTESTTFEKRVSAAIRLRSHLGFTAPYFEYYAQKATKPELKSLCERIYKRKEKEWKLILTSTHSWELQNNIDNLYQKNIKMPLLWFRVLSNLSKLNSEDLKLVEAQKYCPICPPTYFPDPLGSCGVPVKITLKGQTVFLCSKDRIKQAQAEPDKTLASVNRYKRLSWRTKKQLEQDLEKVIFFKDDK